MRILTSVLLDTLKKNGSINGAVLESIEDIANSVKEEISGSERRAIEEFPEQFISRIPTTPGEWTTQLHIWATQGVKEIFDMNSDYLAFQDSERNTVYICLTHNVLNTGRVDYEDIVKLLDCDTTTEDEDGNPISIVSIRNNEGETPLTLIVDRAFGKGKYSKYKKDEKLIKMLTEYVSDMDNEPDVEPEPVQEQKNAPKKAKKKKEPEPEQEEKPVEDLEIVDEPKKGKRTLKEAADEPVIKNGIEFDEDYMWWNGTIPAWYAHKAGDSTNGVVIVKESKNNDGSHDLHVVESPKEEIQQCVDCLSDNLPQDVKRISSHGGISPGGINTILRLKNCGWKLVGTESGESHYWGGGEIRVDDLKKWIDKPEHKNYWIDTGENTGDPLKDTAPNVPIMERQ